MARANRRQLRIPHLAQGRSERPHFETLMRMDAALAVWFNEFGVMLN